MLEEADVPRVQGPSALSPLTCPSATSDNSYDANGVVLDAVALAPTFGGDLSEISERKLARDSRRETSRPIP